MNFKSFKLWLNIVTILALGVLIYISRGQISDTFAGFFDLNLFWMMMVIPLQLMSYYSVASFFKGTLETQGEKLPLSTMYKIALELNFVNSIFPSGGVSGFGYLGVRLKKEGVPTSKSTLTLVTRYSLTFVSFIIYLGVALLLLSVVGSASRLMVLICSTIISLVLVGAGLLIFVISSKQRITKFSAVLPKLVNSVVGVFRRHKKKLSTSPASNDCFEFERRLSSCSTELEAAQNAFPLDHAHEPNGASNNLCGLLGFWLCQTQEQSSYHAVANILG